VDRLDEWERVFRSGDADAYEEPFRLAARIDAAGCYEPLLEPVVGTKGKYYAEWFDLADGAGHDEVRAWYEEVGINNVAMPIRVGSVGVMLIGILLMIIMPETGFHPTPREDRNTWQHMLYTFKQGVDTVRSRPHLMSVVGVGLFYGIYSEGFDRLWVKHLLDTFELPIIFGNNQVAFFAVLRIVGAVLTIFAVRFVEKRVDTGSPIAIGRAMLIVTGLISESLLGFALSPLLYLSLGLYLSIDVLRSLAGPLQTAWVNKKLNSNIRATVHSMFGQVDAIGQVLGGPIVAVIAGVGSAVSALVTSSLLLSPALLFIRRANTQSTVEADGEVEPAPAD
jgi:DHA3 family tetracycline resistance protein-like MFS transporter